MPGTVLVSRGDGAGNAATISGDDGSAVCLLVLGSASIDGMSVFGCRTGVVVSTAEAPRFPESAPRHVVSIANASISGNGIVEPADSPFPRAGLLVMRSAAAPASVAASVRVVNSGFGFNRGPALAIGGTDPAVPGSECVAAVAYGASCGPVDVALEDLRVEQNDGEGILIQNGGPDGRNTAVHLVGAEVRSTGREGLKIRPSVFVPGAGGGARDVLTVADNRISFSGGERGDVPPVEVSFDAAAYAGAPAPAQPLSWVFGADAHTCGADGTANQIFGYAFFHPAIEVANGATATLHHVMWAFHRPDDPQPLVRVVNGGTADVSQPCEEIAQ